MARRGLTWVDHIAINQGATLTPGNLNNQNLTANLIDADRRGATVTRVLLTVSFRVSLIDTGTVAFYGVCMVHEDVAAGGVGIPDPAEDTDQPGWLMRDMARLTVSDLEDQAQVVTIRADLRAQRKFRGVSENLHLVVENWSAGVASFNFDVLSRVLVRLS